MTKKEKSSAALDVNDDASTRTIRASFRKKIKLLQSGKSGIPVSKKTFQELNEAYQCLIENRQEQKLLKSKQVTILSSDVAEFSRLMATHEKETLAFFNFCKEVFEEIVDSWHGRVFNTAGDAILAEFENEFNATHCAIEIQREMRMLNLGQPEGQRVLFRMGLNSGEVFIQDNDLLGDAINIAARIQTAAKPGGICISGGVYDLIHDKTKHTIHFLGEKNYKNIPEAVRTYAITDEDGNFKRPLPDPKIGVAAAVAAKPAGAKAPRRSRDKYPETGNRNLFLMLTAALAVGGIAMIYSRKAETVAIFTSPPVVVAQGHVIFSTIPESQVTFLFNSREVFKGQTPIQKDFDPGAYKVRIENTSLRIDEEVDLLVEEGKLVKFDKVLVSNRPAETPMVAANSNNAAASAPISRKLQEEADQGDPESEYKIGKRYSDKLDFENAYMMLRMAATKGQVQAQYELGVLFYSGHGTPQSNEAAVYWLLKAALGGNKNAGDFLAHNNFPAEYARDILYQRRIDRNDFKGVDLNQLQRLRLEDLKQELEKKQLPT